MDKKPTFTLSDCMNNKLDEMCGVLGQRWNPHIITLVSHGVGKFNQIKKLLTGLSSNMLSDRLKFLEMKGFIKRTIENSRPVSIKYLPTEKGERMALKIKEMVKDCKIS